MVKQKKKLLLLGDSVFDNKVYINPNEKSVEEHLKSKLDESIWDIAVEAVDGATTKTIEHQFNSMQTLPDSNSNIIVSIGGNDALNYVDNLDSLNLETLHTIKSQFYDDYTEAVHQIASEAHQFYLCTIYNPKFSDPVLQKKAEAGLSIFNVVI